MTLERYRAESAPFCNMVWVRPGYLADLAELWDATFGTSFFATRQRMKEITQRNLCSLPSVAISTDGFLADSDIGCPIDDDDWFSPELSTRLLGAPAADTYVWNHLQFGHAIAHPSDPWTSGFAQRVPTETYSCWTNNYAVRGRLLRENPASFLQHFDADPIVRQRGAGYIDHSLSIANNHPASSSFLRLNLSENISGDRLVSVITKYLDLTGQISKGPQELADWALPLMDAVRDWFIHVRSSLRGS